MTSDAVLIGALFSIAGMGGLVFFMFRHYHGRLTEMGKRIDKCVSKEICAGEHGHIVDALKKGDGRFGEVNLKIDKMGETLNEIKTSVALLTQAQGS